MRSSIVLAALLMALLIAVAYYVGLVSDFNAVFKGANTLVNTFTGRTANGTFAGYPGGGVGVVGG